MHARLLDCRGKNAQDLPQIQKTPVGIDCDATERESEHDRICWQNGADRAIQGLQRDSDWPWAYVGSRCRALTNHQQSMCKEEQKENNKMKKYISKNVQIIIYVTISFLLIDREFCLNHLLLKIF